MKIVCIFENCLFAFKFDSESSDEFERNFDLWNDLEYLEEFFENNKTELSSKFWEGITINEAILKTRKDASKFEKKLIDLSQKSRQEQNEGLENLFKPLDDRQTNIRPLNQSKAKQSWLRLYALKIETNIYIITGGAIKLTHKMEESEHTKLELIKIEKCRNFLLSQGITDIEGIITEIEF